MGAAKDRASAQAHQEIGVVRALSEDGIEVEIAGESFTAERAVSCLVRPEPGDEVLLVVPAIGPLYVLAVLRRDAHDPLRIGAEDRELSLHARAVRITGATSVDLAAGSDLRMTARAVELRGCTAGVFFEKVEFVSRRVLSEVERARTAFGVLEGVVDRLTQRIGRSYRYVEDLDLTRAGQIDLRAERALNMRGRHTVITAEQLVKVDGEQIHLG